MRENMVLKKSEQINPVTRECNKEFLYICQQAVLLALKERGLLTERQCRAAEQRLHLQCEEGGTG